MGEAIDAIVFDKDGTLFDFQASWTEAMVRLLDRVAPGDPAAGEAIGFDPGTRAFRPGSVAIAGTAFEMAEALHAVTGRDRRSLTDVIDEIADETFMVPVVDLVSCLGILRQDRKLGLVTNDTEAPARAHLAQAGITGMFDFVAGYDSGFGAKPGPGQLLAFAEATGIAPERTLMVGDSTADLVAGQRARMRCVGVLTGVAGADHLAHLAEVVLPDIGHLAAWISEVGQ